MIETTPRKQPERALLIGLEQNGVSKWDLRDSMEELRELASSAGAEVVDTVTQKLPKPTAPFYIGKGKAEAIKESVQCRGVTSVIFNDELSPAQGRNLENLLSRKVLDRTTRSFTLPNKQRVLLTDTVGFLRNLPHTLIESFKATLEEVSEADLLIHVVDLSHPRVDEQMAAVDSVIKELDAFGKQALIVFNKIDLLENPDLASTYCRRFPGSVAMSAKMEQGIDQFVDALQSALSAWRLRSHFRIPLSESNLIAELHRVGHVLELRYDNEYAVIP